MKENLTKLFEEYVNEASTQDLEVLQHVLKGLQKKQKESDTYSYIEGLLQMNGAKKGDTVEITVPLNPLFNNPLNILHGGVIATVIDSTMGAIIYSTLPKGSIAVTQQLNIHYVAPGIGEYITCKAKIDHHGTQTMVVSAEIFREDGVKVAQASGSFFLIKDKTFNR
jgi:uncharacterized protein (TIGR00369 family)